jgi:hypothetical protein
LEDELVRAWLRRVNEGEGEVVEVAKVDVWHVNIHIVWTHWLLKVLGIEGSKLGIRKLVASNSIGLSGRRQKAGGRQSIFLRGAIIEDQLLWVFLLIILRVAVRHHNGILSISVRRHNSIESRRHHEAADRA